jgi:hypothetical protein
MVLNVEEWVMKERQMQERLKKEKDLRELREKHAICIIF